MCNRYWIYAYLYDILSGLNTNNVARILFSGAVCLAFSSLFAKCDTYRIEQHANKGIFRGSAHYHRDCNIKLLK